MRRRELPGGIPPPTKGELNRRAAGGPRRTSANRLVGPTGCARRRTRPARQARGCRCACAPHQGRRCARPPEAIRREADAGSRSRARPGRARRPREMPRASTRRGSGAAKRRRDRLVNDGPGGPRGLRGGKTRGPTAPPSPRSPPGRPPSALRAMARARAASCFATSSNCSRRPLSSNCPAAPSSVELFDRPARGGPHFCSRADACSALAQHPQHVASRELRELLVAPAAPNEFGEQLRIARHVLEPRRHPRRARRKNRRRCRRDRCLPRRARARCGRRRPGSSPAAPGGPPCTSRAPRRTRSPSFTPVSRSKATCHRAARRPGRRTAR